MIAEDEEYGEFDYHFLREDSHNRWSHKFRNELPRKFDDFGLTIIDLREANIESERVIFYKFQFFLVLEKIGKG